MKICWQGKHNKKASGEKPQPTKWNWQRKRNPAQHSGEVGENIKRNEKHPSENFADSEDKEEGKAEEVKRKKIN